MLRWMCGVTKKNKIRKELITGTVKVADISLKMQERRLKWYGHVTRRDGNYIGRRVLEMEVPGHRRRGQPKYRWKDKVNVDMLEKNLLEHEVLDRCEWQRLARNSDPIFFPTTQRGIFSCSRKSDFKTFSGDKLSDSQVSLDDVDTNRCSHHFHICQIIKFILSRSKFFFPYSCKIYWRLGLCFPS